MEEIKHQFRQEQAMTLNQDLEPFTSIKLSAHEKMKKMDIMHINEMALLRIMDHLTTMLIIMMGAISCILSLPSQGTHILSRKKGTLCNPYSNLSQVVCLFAKHAQCSAYRTSTTIALRRPSREQTTSRRGVFSFTTNAMVEHKSISEATQVVWPPAAMT